MMFFFINCACNHNSINSICSALPLTFSNAHNAPPAMHVPHTTWGRDVTVAVHVSADRLEALTQMCQYWAGAVSAAVYTLPGEEAAVKRWCAMDNLCNCQSGSGETRSSSSSTDKKSSVGRITLRVVHADKLSIGSRSLYPVNTLRNEALRGVKSGFAFGLDADFILGGGTSTLPMPPEGTVFVLPCFKVREPNTAAAGAGWPLTKESLAAWKADGKIVAYGEDPDWPYGHMDVDYVRNLCIYIVHV